MKNTIVLFTLMAVMAWPLAAHAAEKTAPQDAPPPGAAVYPCWNTMQNGHMQRMCGNPQNGHGGWMMMNAGDWKQMQQQMQQMHQQMGEMHQWMMQNQQNAGSPAGKQ